MFSPHIVINIVIRCPWFSNHVQFHTDSCGDFTDFRICQKECSFIEITTQGKATVALGWHLLVSTQKKMRWCYTKVITIAFLIFEMSKQTWRLLFVVRSAVTSHAWCHVRLTVTLLSSDLPLSPEEVLCSVRTRIVFKLEHCDEYTGAAALSR